MPQSSQPTTSTMESSLRSILSLDTRKALFGLILISALLRIVLYTQYPPINYPDTGTYVLLAKQFADLDLSAYDGGRTPIFSLVILLGGIDAKGVYLIQLLLGIAASVLLFFTSLAFKQNYLLAIVAGLIPTLVLNQVFMEANVLSEHVTGVLVVAALFVGVTMLTRGGGPRSAIVLGLLVAATVLARPGYIALVPVYAIVAFSTARQARVTRTGFYLVAACLPIIGWMAVVAMTVGQFGLSTRMGLGLMNHSGAFIEHADPQYAIIRDIYLRHRTEVLKTPEAQINRGGEQYISIFHALDDLKAATGLSQIELSRELAKLSIDLFLRYPNLYAKSVFKAWLTYWTAPIYWQPEAISNPRLATVIKVIWRVEQPLVRLANLVLVLAMVALAIQTTWRLAKGGMSALRSDRQLLVLLLTGGIVFWFAIFQALFEFSENGRYSMPTQQVALAFVIFWVSWLFDGGYAANTKTAGKERSSEHNPSTD